MSVLNPEIEYAERSFIKSFQEKRLVETLEYLSISSDYYKSVFRDYHIDVKSIQSLEDLLKIPVTTKDDLAKYNQSFVCVSQEKIIDYITTSGTVGDPVSLMMTDSDLERLAYNEAISFEVAGCSSSDIIQLTTTIDKRFMAGMAYFLGARKLGAGIIRVGAGMPELQWDSILRFKPTVLIAVPSFILKLIEYAQKNDIDFRASAVKKVICIGEPIRNVNFEFNTLGSKITEAWPVELYSTYASTEMATAFTECKHGAGGHHHPELIIVEFLDDQNNTVEHNMPGEVTITTLGVEGMPLLRYKTGDICYHYEEKCACGRSTTRLGPVIGRKNQMIKYKGTTLFPSSIHEVLNSVAEIESYLIEVSTNEIGTDHILVKLSTKSSVNERFEKELKDHFRAKLRVAPDISIIDKMLLQSIQYPESSRKPILFIDKRTEAHNID